METIQSAFSAVVIALAALTWTPPLLAGPVVPNSAENAVGGAAFFGPLAASQRTYQLLIHENQLTDLVGEDITGLSFRLPSSVADWPAALTEFSNYDIYLSGSVAPADRSLTFADNVVGPQVQVRSGSLEFAAGAFPGAAVQNDFGPKIETQPWSYTGGHLLIEIRHQGFNVTSRTVDALPSAAAGYGTEFSAAWTGDYTGTAGTQANFSVVQLFGFDTYTIGSDPIALSSLSRTGILFMILLMTLLGSWSLSGRGFASK